MNLSQVWTQIFYDDIDLTFDLIDNQSNALSTRINQDYLRSIVDDIRRWLVHILR